MKFFLSLFSLFISLEAFAQDECQYRFGLSNTTMEITDSPQVIQQSFTVYRENASSNGRCTNYRLFFSKGLANNYQRKGFTLLSTLNYNLHKGVNQAGILKDFGDAVSANEFVEGIAQNREITYTNRFYVSVPGMGNSIIRAGLYYDQVQVSIYGYNTGSGNYSFDETETFTVLFYVPRKIQVSLIDEGAAFDASSTSKILDFGILAQNQELGADVRVLSNGPYQLKLSSQNNGHLARSSGNTILYALRVNGSAVELGSSSATPVTIGAGTITTEAGDRYNLRIKIAESTDNKSAGLYQDVITITAISN